MMMNDGWMMPGQAIEVAVLFIVGIPRAAGSDIWSCPPAPVLPVAAWDPILILAVRVSGPGERTAPMQRTGGEQIKDHFIKSREGAGDRYVRLQSPSGAPRPYTISSAGSLITFLCS